MTNNIDYEPSVNNFRRLLQTDDSSKFNLFVKIQDIDVKSKETSSQQRQFHIETTINKARIISKKINEIYQVDPTVSDYTLQIPIIKESTKENKNDTRYEEMIKLLFKSIDNKITFSSEEWKAVGQVLFLLGEEEIKDDYSMRTLEESLSFLCTEFHQKSIEYLSSHFKELFESGTMKYLEDEVKEEIIDRYFADKEKQIEEEEEEEIVRKMIEEEEPAKVVFHFIARMSSEEWSEEVLRFIIERVDDEVIEGEISEFVFNLRRRIEKRLRDLESGDGKKKSKRKSRKGGKIECEYSGNELSGITSFLNQKSEEEGSTMSKVEVSGGGEINTSRPITNLFKYDSDHINEYYYNRVSNWPTGRDSWIKFDFGEQRINLTSYTFRSNSSSPSSHAHPRTWTMSGSDDGEHWEVIDQQTDNPALNGEYKQHRFVCENKNKYYRYIQYKQADSWDTNKNFQYVVYLTCFELFGSILVPTK